jgi:uncharacterized protein YpmB
MNYYIIIINIIIIIFVVVVLIYFLFYLTMLSEVHRSLTIEEQKYCESG